MPSRQKGKKRPLDRRLTSRWTSIKPFRDRLAASVGRWASLQPALSLRLTGIIARVLSFVGLSWFVGRLYGPLPGGVRLRSNIVVRWAKSHLVRRIVEAGAADRLAGLARWTGDADLRGALSRGRPIIVIYPYSDLMSLFHARAHELGATTAVLRNVAPDLNPRLVHFATRPESTPSGRALMLLKGLRQLRAGGVVMSAFHAFYDPGAAEEVIQGRRVRIALGVFQLARLAQATIFPVVLRWAGPASVEFSVREPLTVKGGETDAALLHRAAIWLDAHLTREPQDLTFATHYWISHAPLASTTSSVRGEPAA